MSGERGRAATVEGTAPRGDGKRLGGGEKCEQDEESHGISVGAEKVYAELKGWDAGMGDAGR
jgi:hypothetical protein